MHILNHFFKNLKLLKIQDILTLQTLKIYQKFRNNKLPCYIQNWPLFQNSNIHNHNARGANTLHKNRCLHVFAQKSLKLNIINIVNDTPHIILEKIDTHSLNGFTNYVKLFLLHIRIRVPYQIVIYVRSRILETHKQIVKKKNMDCFIFNH